MDDPNTITLSDEDRAFAESLVEDELFPTVEAAVAGAMGKMRRDFETPADPLAGMADEIRARSETPLEEFIDFEPESFIARVEERVRQRRLQSTAAE